MGYEVVLAVTSEKWTLVWWQ